VSKTGKLLDLGEKAKHQRSIWFVACRVIG
jgi:hypothetical protein